MKWLKNVKSVRGENYLWNFKYKSFVIAGSRVESWVE